MRKYILTADCPVERLDNIGRGIAEVTLSKGTRFTIETDKSRVADYPLDREYSTIQSEERGCEAEVWRVRNGAAGPPQVCSSGSGEDFRMAMDESGTERECQQQNEGDCGQSPVGDWLALTFLAVSVATTALDGMANEAGLSQLLGWRVELLGSAMTAGR